MITHDIITTNNAVFDKSQFLIYPTDYIRMDFATHRGHHVTPISLVKNIYKLNTNEYRNVEILVFVVVALLSENLVSPTKRQKNKIYLVCKNIGSGYPPCTLQHRTVYEPGRRIFHRIFDIFRRQQYNCVS